MRASRTEIVDRIRSAESPRKTAASWRLRWREGSTLH